MKAIDIVLIPEGRCMDDCLAIHAQSKNEENTPLALSNSEYLPHLSLVMGKANDAAIEKVIHTLRKQFTDIQIPFTCSYMHGSWLVVEQTSELMALHTRLMDVIYPMLDHTIPASEKMFFEYEKTGIDTGVYPWINDFKSTAYEKYEPHITLGTVSQSPVELPLTGTFTHLALFHLSNYNTCKKLLWHNQSSRL